MQAAEGERGDGQALHYVAQPAEGLLLVRGRDGGRVRHVPRLKDDS